MEWNWNFGQSVLVLPASVLSADASPEQLRILLWLASDPSLFGKPAQLAKLADCKKSDIAPALQFWRSCGVIASEDVPASVEKIAPVKKTEPEKPSTLHRADELPTYSTNELADMMERRASLRMLVDASQQLMGKMFTQHELNILFGLVDYLSLDEEYILLLLAHCQRMEIKSMRGVEKYAISLIDRGVSTVEALEARMREIEELHSLEGKIRTMFGLKSRSFTSKEKKMLEAWVLWGYGEEIIRLAYEITVGAIKEPSLPYTNSILERWHVQGWATQEQIEKGLEEERAEKQGAPTVGKSFDTDDFFEAALKKSLERNKS
jgi:hypothetical protein